MLKLKFCVIIRKLIDPKFLYTYNKRGKVNRRFKVIFKNVNKSFYEQ